MGHVLPNERDPSKVGRIRAVSSYALAALLSIAIVVLLLRLWRTDLTTPFIDPRGDGAFTSLFVKSIIENGWYLTNPRLGVPEGMKLYDFPLTDNLHFLLIRMLSYFSSNWAVVLNVYFLLTFPLTTLSALLVCRRFGCRYLPSLLGSLLFTLLPYHFMRGEVHLFLAAYYLVPLMILLILEVFLDAHRLPPQTPGPMGRSWMPSLARVVICILVASAGIYYTFFGCFLLLVAGIAGAFFRSTLRPLLKSAGLIMILSLATAGNLSPTIAYQIQHGRNRECLKRSPIHAEVFALKPVQLLLPVTGHRLHLFNKVKSIYNRDFQPLVNENDQSSLGMIGSLGLILMLGRALYRRDYRTQPEIRDALALLALACIVLGTMGGLSSLFALLISPKIRSYNRICVYIAFFAFFTIVLAVEGLATRFFMVRRGRLLYGLFLLALLTVGIWDQTIDRFTPAYAWIKEEFRQDEAFIREIEARLPEGAWVFQLPYAGFPEQGSIHQMIDYDHLRGYLHSKKLCWSYGCIKGRAGDAWSKEVSSKLAEELVRTIAQAGFRGIYINRMGFADGGVALESQLTSILKVRPLVSGDNALAFFDMSEYGQESHSLPRNEGTENHTPSVSN
jgi:phosphoglycerol transferase